MRWLFLFLLFVVYGFQCNQDIEFDGSERLLLTGKVTSNEGVPLEGIHVGLYGTKDYPYIDFMELINEIKTNNDGYFELIFSDPDIDELYLSINNQINDYQNKNTLNKSFSNRIIEFNKSRFENFKYDITDYCKLDKGVELILINNSDGYASISIESENNIKLDSFIPYFSGLFEYSLSKTESMVSMQSINSTVIVSGYISGYGVTNPHSFLDTLQLKDQSYQYVIK